jgi:hypothetical protein
VRDVTAEALLRLLRAEPEEWSSLAPRVAAAVGAGRLREIAESTRRITGGVSSVEPGSAGGFVASGPLGKAMVYGSVSPDGLVTGLWIQRDTGVYRLGLGKGQVAWNLLVVVLAAGATWNAWCAHSRADWAASAFWILSVMLWVEGLGTPAQLPWWFRRTWECLCLAGLLAAVRLPGLANGTIAAGLVLGIVLAVAVAVVIIRVRTRGWDAEVSVPMEFPLRGRWYVLQGGPSVIVNHHFRVPEQRAALDLVRTGSWGTRRGRGRGNESYLAYGEPVCSPCDGTVVTARDIFPDQEPGTVTPQPPEGNAVVIDTGREHIRLAHLRPGSVRVARGQQVRAGELVGEVGNSGNTSEPHLHIDASRDGIGVALRFTANPGHYYRGRTLRGLIRGSEDGGHPRGGSPLPSKSSDGR